MNRSLFFRGILLSLRSSIPRDFHFFTTKKFLEGYTNGLKRAVQKGYSFAQEILDEYDPMFGIHPSVSEMLYEGSRDFIIEIAGGVPTEILFKISTDVAYLELRQYSTNESLMFHIISKSIRDKLPVHHIS